MNKVFSFILAAMLCLPAAAQKLYSLADCVNLALQNNVKMKKAANSVVASKEQKKEAFANYIPTVSAMGVGFVSNKDLVQMDLSPMGIPQTLGMVDNGVLGSVSAMVPLYAGGQIATGNKLADVGLEVSKLQQNVSANEVRLTTEQYFWNIVMLKEKLHTLDVVDNQLASIQKDVDVAVKAGVTNRNDLLQVNLKKNEVRSSRITVENTLKICRNLLAQQMGLGIDSVDVACTIGSQLPESPASLYASAESSLQNTNEYQLLQQNVKAQKLQYKMAVGKNLPTVAIGGMYSYNNLLDKSQNNLIGLATVSIPITGWIGGSHGMKKQKIEMQNAEDQLKDNGELLMINMQNKWNSVTDAYKQLEIAKESIAQSEENLRLENDYYKAGTCTMTDLLQAQTLYQQSRDKYVEQSTQYEVKKLEYLQATGR